MTTIQGVRAHDKAVNIAVWMLQAVAALVFVGAGSGKLVGSRDMVALFDAIGVGQWLRYVTGMWEVLGALLVVAPGTAAVGAALIGCVMIGAVVAHVTMLQTSPAGPLVLLVIAAAIAWGRWPPRQRRRRGVTVTRCTS